MPLGHKIVSASRRKTDVKLRHNITLVRELLNRWSRKIPNLTRLEAGHLAKPQRSFGGCNLAPSFSDFFCLFRKVGVVKVPLDWRV